LKVPNEFFDISRFSHTEEADLSLATLAVRPYLDIVTEIYIAGSTAQIVAVDLVNFGSCI
jgi:hypothetical protein